MRIEVQRLRRRCTPSVAYGASSPERGAKVSCFPLWGKSREAGKGGHLPRSG